MQPNLTFFCELEADALQSLFADDSVIKNLTELKASVSLGILDLSPERAAVVLGLNEAGIPVIAWQLLPMEQGYWFNLDNAPQAATRYGAFKAWTAKYALQWAGIGVDIEPDIRELQQLMEQKRRLFRTFLQRVFDNERLRVAQAAYSSLITQMRVDGYCIDSYHLPPIVDERRVGATLLQRIAGLVDIPADREVLMLYTSFLRPRGPGILWSYAQDAQSIGVGSTGGGVQVAGIGDIPPLDWDEFSRDLRFAQHWSDDIHIFSLEGCVRQGFLKQLKTFDWDSPITPPYDSAREMRLLRRGLQAVLWASAHPLIVLISLFCILWLLSLL